MFTKFVSTFLSAIILLSGEVTELSHSLSEAIASNEFLSSIMGSAACWIRDLALDGDCPEKSDYVKNIVYDDTQEDFVTMPEFVINAQTWVANEVVFESDKTYSDPFNDVDVDLVLVGNGVKYIVPGFWDGGNTWKIRFVCPTAGEWLFKTVCSDEENAALHGRTGKVICTQYDGELEIFCHGFLTNEYNKKYLTYDDATPFFYLGDTHWSLGDETVDMVNTICKKRVEQGFTVFQSEPIGATFDVTDGISNEDMAGFADYDAKFSIVAGSGLVHANAQFFFPYYMETLINNFGGYSDSQLCSNAKNYLEKLSRYWVARYGAYPVVWTLGQEVDRDFYQSREGSTHSWTHENNPYKLVAEYIAKYDAYSQPITAHQENSGGVVAYGNGEGVSEKRKKYVDSMPSAFRDVKAHSLYAAQWSPDLIKNSDQKIEREYWFNSQGKPVINYEGRYCYLWTKNFGSRMQGWASYLSGMFGYGWGAHDTWSYLNIYSEDSDSDDGVDIITSEEKTNATWQDALEYPSGYQVGYMKNFFTSFDWWNLIPRFSDPIFFLRDAGVFAYAASNADNSKMVIYFYSFNDETVAQMPNADLFGGTMTGKIGCLEPSTVYKYKWFNPITGEYSEEMQFTSSPLGTYIIGPRTWQGETVSCDMVFYMYK